MSSKHSNYDKQHPHFTCKEANTAGGEAVPVLTGAGQTVGLACSAQGMVVMVQVSAGAGAPGWPSSSAEMPSDAFRRVAEAPAVFLCLACTSGPRDDTTPRSSSSHCQVYLLLSPPDLFSS